MFKYIKKIYNRKLHHAFRKSCAKGNIKFAMKIYELEGINIHENNDLAFILSCEHGQMEIAKWLYSLGGVNIHIYSDHPFITSCRNGHLEVAKWLYTLGNIDIHSYDDYAFELSCEKGHLEVAKWLYGLGDIDIHTYNDEIFKLCCVKEQIEIVKWLCTLCGDYKIEIVDNKITKFNITNSLEDVDGIKNYDKIIDKMNIKINHNKEECSICFDTDRRNIQSVCKHNFCVECIFEWIYVNKKNTCPYCRQQLIICKNDDYSIKID